MKLKKMYVENEVFSNSDIIWLKSGQKMASTNFKMKFLIKHSMSHGVNNLTKF